MPTTAATSQSGHMDSDELKGRLAGASRREVPELVRELVIERDQPHCFAEDDTLFPRVQEHIAGSLKIDPSCVLLVGSGCVGYSIAPDTFPKEFHAGSDLDFAIVSDTLFDGVWDVLLSWGHPRRHRLPANEQEWFDKRKDEVFWGWIDVEYLRIDSALQVQHVLKPLRRLRAAWFDAFQSVSGAFPGTEIAGRDVGGRLYRTEEQLVHYQADGLRQLKYRLARASKKE